MNGITKAFLVASSVSMPSLCLRIFRASACARSAMSMPVPFCCGERGARPGSVRSRGLLRISLEKGKAVSRGVGWCFGVVAELDLRLRDPLGDHPAAPRVVQELRHRT